MIAVSEKTIVNVECGSCDRSMVWAAEVVNPASRLLIFVCLRCDTAKRVVELIEA